LLRYYKNLKEIKKEWMDGSKSGFKELLAAKI
jgi:hypothetical protein